VVDFYASDAASPHDEAHRYIGFRALTARAGRHPFAVTMPARLCPSDVVTATATAGEGSTSPLCRAVAVTRAERAAVVVPLSG